MLWEFLWKNRVALSLSFCISFSLFCIIWQYNPFSQNMGYLGRLVERLSGLMNSGLRFTGNLWVEWEEYRSLEERYKKAQKSIEAHRLEKDKFAYIQRQYTKLRKLLDMPVQKDYPEVQAQVLALRLNAISPRIIIGKGKKHGIRPLMPVISRSYDKEQRLVRSVVGITVVADSTSAVIQPLLHPSFQIGVRIASSQEWALLSGNSGQFNEALLTYITTNFHPETAIVKHTEAPLLKEAEVYTSGAGGIFPPGIAIGMISGLSYRKNDFKTAYVKPYAEISQLDYVSVILKKVETWSSSMDRSLRWEEHLKTEFGAPQYPPITKKKKKQGKKKTLRRQQKNKDRIPNKAKKVQPRRLQNVQGASF